MGKREVLAEQLNIWFSYISEKERLILTLFYYEDLTVEEIAVVLELNSSEVVLLFNQAKTIIRQFTDIFDRLDKVTK